MQIVKNISYTAKRNTRMASYKGNWNCEIKFDGAYVGDAQGDTEIAAKQAAERKVNQWIADRKVRVRK